MVTLHEYEHRTASS